MDAPGDRTAVGPTVTVLIPARDEARDIGRALGSVLRQDHPSEMLQIVVVDGGSSDGTAEVARALLDQHPRIEHRIVDNPTGSTPSNLNAGLAVATGQVLCRVDARSVVPADYVRRCVELLEDPSRAVVGGAQVAIARDGSASAIGIARALNNRWGMGLSKYRRGAASGPTDTVYLGAFRTEQLRAVGGWDERFRTNQDYELNRRMGRIGAVWFESGLEVGYSGRETVAGLFRQYQRFGRWKVRYWRTTGDRPARRQTALLTLPPLLLVGVIGVARRPKLLPGAACCAVAAAGLIETAGANGPRGGLAARLVAVTALAAVATGWTSGVWLSVLRGRRADD